MGKSKYKQEVLDLLRKSSIVSYTSIAKIINHKKKTKSYAKRMINYLIKSGAIKRLTKGYYTTTDNASLAVLSFQPAYLGLQDALSFHDIWEQETVPIIITSQNVRQGIRKVLNTNIIIRRIESKYLFGMEYHQQENVALPYSDIEKTFIDMIYFKENISEEVIAEFKKRLDKNKLKRYLKIYQKKTREKANLILKIKDKRLDG